MQSALGGAVKLDFGRLVTLKLYDGNSNFFRTRRNYKRGNNYVFNWVMPCEIVIRPARKVSIYCYITFQAEN